MKNGKIIFLILVCLTIASGIFFRFWRLDSIPPGIQYDEAFNGINALAANETGEYKVFYPENWGREGFHINVTALFVKFIGAKNISLRLASALWGSITIIGFYFLLKKFHFTRLAILMGTFMLALSFWHLDFSRTAYRAIMVPMLIIWTIYFFLSGLEREKKWDYNFFVSGALLGLGLHSYIAFRIAPLIVIAIALAYWRAKKEFLQKYWRNLALFLFVSVIVALPIINYFYHHQGDLMLRTEAVSIFDDPKSGYLESFSKSLVLHARAIFLQGDKNPRHNYNQNPLLPPVFAAVFLIGFIASIWEIIAGLIKWSRRKNNGSGQHNQFPGPMFLPSLIAQTTLWLMLLPGILTYEGAPHTLRIIGAIPAVYLLASFPFVYLAKSADKYPKEDKFPSRRKNRQLLAYSLAAGVFLTGILQPYIYFKLWASDPLTLGGFEKRLFDLGNLVNELPTHKNNYLITGYNATVNKEHTQSSYKTTEYIANPKIKNYQYYRPMDGRTAINCDDPLVVFQDSDQWLRDQYMLACPGLKPRVVVPEGGYYAFWVLSY